MLSVPVLGLYNVYNHYFQMSSSLKRLCKSNANVMWSLLGKREYGVGHMTKKATMPPYGQNLLEPEKFNGFEALHEPIRDSQVYKVYIYDDPDLFYGKVKFGQNCLLCLFIPGQ